MKRSITTREQREAVYRLFKRHYYDDMPKWMKDSLSRRAYFSLSWRRLYRAYRRRFQIAGFGSDLYLFGQPFTEGEGQMWVGIESDGYTHS